jgi:hypothetical protein
VDPISRERRQRSGPVDDGEDPGDAGLFLETTRYIQRQALHSIAATRRVGLRASLLPIANLIQAGLAKRQTASIYLKQLSDLGIPTASKLDGTSYSFI